ncbi:MAG: MgtC/SapB family protein [Anaerolineae bacterium]
MDESVLFLRFGSALAIGLLVGMQREFDKGARTRRLFAGVRTFPLLSLSGAAGGLLNHLTESPLPLVAVMLALGALILWAYVSHTRSGRVGATTEVAAVLTILSGALCYYGEIQLAAALAVVMTALLTLKVQIHGFVRHLGQEDLYAVVKFAVITAVVLPVLPNQTYGSGPLDVLNPHRIWLMVVFVSGISFLGYVLVKQLGPSRGVVLNGLLGGLVSSTAVTASLAQRSREYEELAEPMALATVLSWAVSFVRVLVIIAVLNMPLALRVLPALLVSAVAGLLYGGLLLLRRHDDELPDPAYANPFELRPALTFGLLYAAILVVARAAEVNLGSAGVYLSSVAGSLVSQTAVSVSLAEAAGKVGRVAVGTAAWALVLSSAGNMALKGSLALASGAPGLRRVLWPAMVAMVLAAVGVALVTI